MRLVSIVAVSKISICIDIFKISIHFSIFLKYRYVSKNFEKKSVILCTNFFRHSKRKFCDFLRQFLEKLVKNYPKNMKLF